MAITEYHNLLQPNCKTCEKHCCFFFMVNLKPWEVDQFDTLKFNGYYFLRREKDGKCVYLKKWEL